MAEALYRKYRSRKLSEVVGQEHITKTLTNSIKAGKINHAYLLTGPKGVGKTSIARILAHEFNGLQYTEDKPHLDIIEIDAASNRRIDEIRDLRDKVHITPTSAKYKVYIIDEVHMLTREAFNALLKTLEEPPAHAIFILATTEAHKLPETIISRTQRFTFKPIDDTLAINHLKKIAATEEISIDDESLALIASHGAGSFRDSISLLDQLSSYKTISVDTVLETIGVVPAELIDRLIASLLTGTAKELIDTLNQLKLSGYSAVRVAKQLSESLRSEMIENGNSGVLVLLKNLLDVFSSTDAEQLLELILLEFKLTNSEQTAEAITVVKPVAIKAKQVNSSEKKLPEVTKKPSTSGKILPDEVWNNILKEVKKRHNTLYTVLRMGQPVFVDKNTVELTFRFPFHQKQISEAKNLSALKKIISEHTDKNINILTKLEGNTEQANNNSQVKTISNIFGGAEVLE